MGRKKKTIDELEQRCRELREMARKLKGIVGDDALQAIDAEAKRAKRELAAARAAERRAQQQRSDTVNAAVKTWIGGEVLAITGLTYAEVDVRAMSAWLVEHAESCRTAVALANQLGAEEASERCSEWQVAIATGHADRATGTIDQDAGSDDYDDGWRAVERRADDGGGAPTPYAHSGGHMAEAEPPAGHEEGYAQTNVWHCSVCNSTKTMRTMRPIDDGLECYGCGGEMTPMPPDMGLANQ